MKKETSIQNFKVLSTEDFSADYSTLNKCMVESKEIQKSRNGDTKEFLNFKTELTNPYKRCVGGLNRDTNIFFLLAEAMWIFLGRRDVKLLSFFNAKMVDYSDDKISFHAPYGFRLRHYNMFSEDYSYQGDMPNQKTDSNKHAFSSSEALDQIKIAIEMLTTNPDDRRVVLSIWNANQDLNFNSKDLPCNDMVMLKIRNKKLHLTIANRSNDLHWGLVTNIFQFSFIGEIMSSCLGIEYGTQVHNSQSLHIYLENPISSSLYAERHILDKWSKAVENYSLYAQNVPKKMDFNFRFDLPKLKLVEVDTIMNILVSSIEKKIAGIEPDLDALKMIDDFSTAFGIYYRILEIYVDYKKEISQGARREAIERLFALKETYGNIDVIVLALNFFVKRFKENQTEPKQEIHFTDKLIGKY